MRIYQAGPLFTEAEQDWHRTLKAQLTAAGFDVLWPYEAIDQEELKALGPKAKDEVFARCRDGMLGCGIMVALLDGPMVDDGTAWEVGYFHALGRGPIYGIRTDFRHAGEAENSLCNPMIECSCTAVARSREELLTLLTARHPQAI